MRPQRKDNYCMNLLNYSIIRVNTFLKIITIRNRFSLFTNTLNLLAFVVLSDNTIKYKLNS